MADALTMLNLSQANAAATTTVPADRQAATHKAAEQFEAVFLSQVLDSVFSGVNPNAMFGGGQSQQIYRSMMNEQIAGHMVKGRGVGIADAVYKELIKLQEAQGMGGRL